MNQTTQQLNLARKWRPKTFDDVVGQGQSISMLKNSLSLSKFFPVYLFAGQRGCGKTSTARIFAAATNCQNLAAFQNDPANTIIPCLQCPSCVAMINGNHPDFIEIDAASHTGVDNVRQIIESSSYKPLTGRKKIYLIDEAHMLSKAAFNAFLKILEEPPVTVLFILATTETLKIPQTVMSRCFHLTFNPINAASLSTHLQQICAAEQVEIDATALDIILDETDGSARDAINLLERVRFLHTTITEQTVLDVLGKIGQKDLLTLFEHIVDNRADMIISHLQVIRFEHLSASIIWDMFVQLCRYMIWVKYGQTTLPHALAKNMSLISRIASKCSLNRLTAIINFLWHQEDLFLKTNNKHVFLEMTFVQLCQQVNVADLESLLAECRTLRHQPAASPLPMTSLPSLTAAPAPLPIQEQSCTAQEQPPVASAAQGPWQTFVAQLASTNDPLLCSIFKQATLVKQDATANTVTIQLHTQSAFLKTKIDESKGIWQPILAENFPGCSNLSFALSPSVALQQPPTQAQPAPDIQSRPSAMPQMPPQGYAPTVRPKFTENRQQPQTESTFITIKDPSKWPQASLILQHFPGKIRKVATLEKSILAEKTDGGPSQTAPE